MNGTAAYVLAALFSALMGAAQAKLPALSDDQKAKTAEAKEKAAAGAKLAAEQLGKAQDRAVERYKKEKGKAAAPAAAGAAAPKR